MRPESRGERDGEAERDRPDEDRDRRDGEVPDDEVHDGMVSDDPTRAR